MIGATVVGKAGGDGDDLVARLDAPLAELRRGQRHEGQQIGRGARIGQGTVLHAEKLGELPLESFGIAAGGQPEIKGGIDQVVDLSLIEHPAGIGDAVTGREAFFVGVLACS